MTIYDAIKRFADITPASIALTLCLPFRIWASIAIVLAIYTSALSQTGR